MKKTNIIFNTLTTLLLCIFSLKTYAVLPEGLQQIRYSISMSNAVKLWKKKDTAPAYMNGGVDGKNKFTYHQLEYHVGLAKGFQIDTGLSFGNSEMVKGSEGGSVAGDTQSGIQDLSLGTEKSLWINNFYSLSGSFNYKYRFQTGKSSIYSESPDTFISLSDGTNHLSFGLVNNFSFNKLFSAHLLFNYILRDNDLADQYTIQLLLPFNVTESLQVGLGLNLLQTLGGLDIGGTGFSDEVTNRSGGNSKIKAFSAVKEEVLGTSVFIAYVIDTSWSIDIYAHQKLQGRNTDVSTSYGLGVNLLF